MLRSSSFPHHDHLSSAAWLTLAKPSLPRAVSAASFSHLGVFLPFDASLQHSGALLLRLILASFCALTKTPTLSPAVALAFVTSLRDVAFLALSSLPRPLGLALPISEAS